MGPKDSSVNADQEYREKLLEFLRLVLARKIDFVTGIRELDRLIYMLDEQDNPLFLPIISFQDDMTDFPVGEMRKHCAVSYLEKMDEEMSNYLRDAETDILQVCAKIVKHLELGIRVLNADKSQYKPE